MHRQFLTGKVAGHVVGGGLANQMRLLRDVSHKRTAGLCHDLQRLRTGVDGRHFHILITAGLFQCLDDTDGRLIPAGDMDGVQFAFRILAE